MPPAESGSDRTVRRVAVLTPEYWPRPHILAPALAADEVLLLDSFQYSRQSYQNRARLRKPDGWHWISVPLEARQHGRPISEVRISRSSEWRGAHCRSLQHDYGTAPFFAHYSGEIFDLIRGPWSTLGDLTCATVEWTLRAIDCHAPISRTSSLDPAPRSAAELASALGGVEVVCADDAAERLMQVFKRLVPAPYREAERYQNFGGFEPGMSALDLLFNHGPEARALVERDASFPPDFR
ncbi:MAG TPA: WbqC family protein [Rhodothermales bacterium]